MNFIIRIVALALLCLPLPAAAQDSNTYPNRAVHMIVPFPPGGPADIIARVRR